MEPYFELAFALESKSLSFFVGTGFSMYLTDGAAPSWLSLLKDCAKQIDGGDELIEQLFPDNKPIMPLEECASIIQAKMHTKGLCLHTEIAKVIDTIKISNFDKPAIEFIKNNDGLKFMTTNYDLLLEKQVLDGLPVTSYAIGYPIHRQPKGTQVYHVHGSVKYPKKMIVTADDYYRFINRPDYFSHKVETLFEENTVVIIGYSLGDINFKSILNKLRSNRQHDINRQHLFYLSRSVVDQHIKDYYDRSYGLRVIDGVEVDEFFTALSEKHSEISPRVDKYESLLLPVLEKKKKFTDAYLKKSDSFFEILALLSSNGIIVSHQSVMEVLLDVLERKRGFTTESGAWEQYVHLAKWLIHLGSIMDISGTPLEETYLKAVERSFNNMSKKRTLGLSWHAFKAWKNHWCDLTYDNRVMVYNYMIKKGVNSDGSEVIEQ
ncbi:TPA: SIR2 family protein [Vibrio vulnificus]|uniref:SIR2 family NAD-dependent protein deacylase n=1 Tax=Vibrio natriegens TaxID=691 RepID=UPI001EFCFC24|nr:SIR2 family protein [Vibrio natriegens]HDZ3738642.1 SIR2 family protein [Vibrio vulnificus]HEB2779405.1 SIR2 family protein [Vibrio vulnificus]